MTRHVEEIKAKLFDAFFRGMDLQELTEYTSTFLENPLIVCDAGYRITAHSAREKITDVFWSEYIRMGYCPYEFVARVSDYPEVRQGRKSGSAFQLHCRESDNNKIACKIRLDGVILGSVILLDCQSPFQAADHELISAIAPMLGRMMDRAAGPRDSTAAGEDLLLDLIEGRLVNRDELRGRLRMSGLHQPDKLQALVFDYSGYVGRDDGSDLLRDAFRQQWQFPHCFFSGDYIVAVGEPQQVDRLAWDMECFCGKNRLYAGVSSVFGDLLDFREAYRQAAEAAGLARREVLGSRLVHYRQTVFFSLLPRLTGEQALQRFCHPALRQLIDYDSRHEGDLLPTLYVYLMENRNVQRTAEKCYLHRNTVRYKIQKILSTTGLDLEDMLEVHNVLMSYQTLRYYLGPGFPEQFVRGAPERGAGELVSSVTDIFTG